MRTEDPRQRTEDPRQFFCYAAIYCFANRRRGGCKGPLVAFGFLLQPAAGSNIPVPFLTEDGLTFHDSSTVSTPVKETHRKMDYAVYSCTVSSIALLVVLIVTYTGRK